MTETPANLKTFPGKKVLMIDNYDSFTFNLVQYLQMLKLEVITVRNDEKSCSEIVALNPDVVVLSPGPSTPDQAGICLEWVKTAADKKIPTFGVCLGHQTIGQAFGGQVVRSALPMHGKVSKINHFQKGVFKDLPNPMSATRYHSLEVDRHSIPQELEVTSTTDDQTIMGLRHKSLPIEGVQFHPESVLTVSGIYLLANFIDQI